MKTWLNAVLAAGASLVAGSAGAQSFNIDLDGFFGPRSLGTGVPQPSFGGAAGQPGYWNAIYALEHRRLPLRSVSGEWTIATYQAYGGIGSGGGWRNPRLDFGIVNDDFWLLMGDAAEIGAPIGRGALYEPALIVYTFEGLEPGLYDVYTYAVSPSVSRHSVPVAVTVPGAATENPQISTGPMPLDWKFRRGVTHTLHRVQVDGGLLEVRVSAPDWPPAFINGFQIVKVK
ncbi:MAG: hypothetical protein AB1725_05100 [Armatimonadota bacterium]